jgi:hypothetical protein
MVNVDFKGRKEEPNKPPRRQREASKGDYLKDLGTPPSFMGSAELHDFLGLIRKLQLEDLLAHPTSSINLLTKDKRDCMPILRELPFQVWSRNKAAKGHSIATRVLSEADLHIACL